MKHLLNDLSNQEKQRILEQYNNSLLINTKKFNKLIESELGDVRPLLEQDPNAPYPNNRGLLDISDETNEYTLEPTKENNIDPELPGVVEMISDEPYKYYYIGPFGVTVAKPSSAQGWRYVTTKNNSKIELIKRKSKVDYFVPKYEINIYTNKDDSMPAVSKSFSKFTDISLYIPRMISTATQPNPAANKN